MTNALLLFIMMCAAFMNSQKQTDEVFDRLYLLEGSWKMTTKKGAIVEEWVKVSKYHLQSRGYMIKGIDTIKTENVTLRKTAEGIFYTSTVADQNNQQPVAFRLTSSLNNVFVFENPLHDYPKRISYSFINNDSLHAWIDDGKDVPEKKSSFRYSRQK